MRLLYAPASPFARIVRIALIETGLDSRVSKQAVDLYTPDSMVIPLNPVARVPTLELDDGTVLSESSLILAWVDAQHGARPLLPRDGSDGWRILSEMGTAWGLMDGIVAWARALRPPEPQRAPRVIEWETQRVNRIADRLEQAVGQGGYTRPAIDAAQIVLGTAFGWVEPRHPVWKWRESRPALSAWADRIHARPSFQATIPPPL
ncbi:MAG: glutathione S-transferase family protein [Proteobacteria bacterium]|nr:glutathione S-transferase family protein [Pseudomonadota bacterium]